MLLSKQGVMGDGASGSCGDEMWYEKSGMKDSHGVSDHRPPPLLSS